MVNVPSNLLDSAKQAAPDLWPVLVAIAMNESSDGRDGDYTVDCRTFYTKENAPAGAWPTSFGPLQLHAAVNGCQGGLGGDHTPDQLRDWPANFTIGANYIRGRLGQGASIYDALSPWSTRDADYALYQRIETEGANGVSAPAVAGVSGGPASGSSPATVGPVATGRGGLALIGLIALLLVLD